ncbi:MAG: LamG-like jellyroll fold domain-containing protein [Planctomycetota bacterium]|jgi:hypothetical protein
MAVSLNGSSQYVNVTQLGYQATNQCCIAAIVKPGNLSASQHMIVIGHRQASPDYRMYLYWNYVQDRLQFTYAMPGSASSTYSNSFTLETNKWQLWVINYDQGGGGYWVDNVDKGITGGQNHNVGFPSLDTYIGARNNGGSPDLYFDGEILAVAFWDAPLNANERANLYNGGVFCPQLWAAVKPENNLFDLWIMDEGIGTVTYNRKRGAGYGANRHNGTLVGSPSWAPSPHLYPAIPTFEIIGLFCARPLISGLLAAGRRGLI